MKLYQRYKFFINFKFIDQDLEDFKKQLEDHNNPQKGNIDEKKNISDIKKEKITRKPKKLITTANLPSVNLFDDYRKALDTGNIYIFINSM